jgi:transketolase
MSLRAIPNFKVYRPADAKETASCIKMSIEDKNTPSALLLTRQGVPILDGSQKSIGTKVSKGAYSVLDCKGNPDIIILATGSEVSLSIEVAKKLEEKKVRVISMPCWEIFNEQPDEYKKELIPDRGSLKVSIEAGITNGWEKYIGSNGLAIGINHFGMSAPANDLAIEFGFTSEQIRNKIEKYLKELL